MSEIVASSMAPAARAADSRFKPATGVKKGNAVKKGSDPNKAKKRKKSSAARRPDGTRISRDARRTQRPTAGANPMTQSLRQNYAPAPRHTEPSNPHLPGGRYHQGNEFEGVQDRLAVTDAARRREQTSRSEDEVTAREEARERAMREGHEAQQRRVQQEREAQEAAERSRREAEYRSQFSRVGGRGDVSRVL